MENAEIKKDLARLADLMQLSHKSSFFVSVCFGVALNTLQKYKAENNPVINLLFAARKTIELALIGFLPQGEALESVEKIIKACNGLLDKKGVKSTKRN